MSCRRTGASRWCKIRERVAFSVAVPGNLSNVVGMFRPGRWTPYIY